MEKMLLTPRDDMFTIKGFLSDDECNSLIERAETIGFGESTVNTPTGAVVNKGMRNNDRVLLDDPALAGELWEKLKALVPEKYGNRPVGLNERLRFYRYEPGQFFDWHFDAPYNRTSRESSFLTFMIYLNDCESGTTDFTFKTGVLRDDDPIISVKPEKGMALVFTHNVLHRGSPVKDGKKYVVRSDVMYRT